MNQVILALFSIFIAAVIGYVTNYLAIRMLFHPRREWKIAGRRVPFTPGLIPKRKLEIAAALGRVVSDYLVTADGLRNMLLQPEMRAQIERRLHSFVEEWSERDETLEKLAVRLAGEQAVASMKAMLAKQAELGLTTAVRRALRDAPVMHRPLEETLKKLNVPLDRLVQQDVPRWIIKILLEELSSPQSVNIIRRVVTQMLDGIGGMMGMLAGMFVDEEKITLKVRQAIMQYLQSEAALEALSVLLRKQVSKFGAMPPKELLRLMREKLEQDQWLDGSAEDGRESSVDKSVTEGGRADDQTVTSNNKQQLAVRQSDEDWYASWLMTNIPWRSWLERFWLLTPRMILRSHKDWLLNKVPIISERAVITAANHIEQVVHAVNLPKLVQDQVEKFPIEQVEKVILSITGREFKAITWLGALLGGLIGTIQVLVYFVLG